MIRPGKSSTGYTWLRDALIPGESAVLEAIWAYPWIGLALASVRSTAHRRFPFIWIVGLIAVPALAGRWMERSISRGLIVRRFALLLVTVVLFLLFVSTETLPPGSMTDGHRIVEALWPWGMRESDHQALIFFGWLVACILLIRGVWLAEGEITGESAPRWFLGGLAAFTLLFAGLSHSPPAAYSADRSWLGPLVILYFFLGMGWVALVQRQRVEERTFRRSSNRLSLSWLAVFTAVASAVALAGLFAALLTVLAFRPVEQVAILLLDGGWHVVTVISTGIANAVAYVIHDVLRLFDLLPHGSRRPHGTAPGGSSPPPLLPAWFTRWLTPAAVALFVLLALVALAAAAVVIVRLAGLLLFGRSRRGIDVVGDEERTSLWSWEYVLAQLGILARRLAATWPSRPRRLPAPETNTTEEPPSPAPASVRGLYRSMLQWCRERGCDRRGDETPREFEPALARNVPQDLAHQATDAYVKARYGRASIPEDAFALLVDRWEAYRHEAGDQPPEPEPL